MWGASGRRTRRICLGRALRQGGEGWSMAERSSKPGGPDRKHVEGRAGYEVDELARKHGISNDQASRLIRIVGNDREKLDEEAAKLKKR
jgi:hypothetical protein